MTNYAGELYEISCTAEDFDASSITPLEIEDMVVEVRSAAGTVVRAEVEMTYDEERSLWYYQWDTDDIDPGSYRAKCTMTDLLGRVNFEFKRIRLARPTF